MVYEYDPSVKRRRNEPVPTRLSFVEAFFAWIYAPMLSWSPKCCHGLKPVPMLLLAALGGHGIWAVTVAMQMEPSLDSINLSFPHDHAFYGIREHVLDFLSSGTNDHAPGFLLLGVAGYDRDAVGFSTMVPDAEPRGVVRWDSQFDLSDRRAQIALNGLCEALQAAPCVPGGVACMEGFGRLVVPDSVRCVMPFFYANVTGRATFFEELSSNQRELRDQLLEGNSFTAAIRDWTLDRDSMLKSIRLLNGPGNYATRELAAERGGVGHVCERRGAQTAMPRLRLPVWGWL